MGRVGVMHLTDTLEAGGTERVAVNLVNLLPRDRYRPYLCTTRHDGPMARRVSGVIAVNQPLAAWSQQRLGVPAERVWYIPNFVCEAAPGGALAGLPGEKGARIVCVANLRPQKDHQTLLRAMARVSRQAP